MVKGGGGKEIGERERDRRRTYRDREGIGGKGKSGTTEMLIIMVDLRCYGPGTRKILPYNRSLYHSRT
jgi:hypothetical protein